MYATFPQTTGQLFWFELPYNSYQSRAALRGQRIGRLLDTLRSTSPPYQALVLWLKLCEYLLLLGDPLQTLRPLLFNLQLQHGFTWIHPPSLMRSLAALKSGGSQ